jgi:hypothetical protein
VLHLRPQAICINMECGHVINFGFRAETESATLRSPEGIFVMGKSLAYTYMSLERKNLTYIGG